MKKTTASATGDWTGPDAASFPMITTNTTRPMAAHTHMPTSTLAVLRLAGLAAPSLLIEGGGVQTCPAVPQSILRVRVVLD